ncbi:type II secretion system minor pseudopilin GspI [Verticiella sediminum]|uniref:type II secretion system minor pseudopilin GspI n=1 Tax=Verticiella sediminum TaxID=1247510 RepID=UPI001FE49099|nr:type II secretion system minor pseudopilin GspI [Verticiella sediminum]
MPLGRAARGFTLIEVLIALAIVAVALGAAVRAAGMIAGNDAGLRERAIAVLSAENRLAEMRLAREFPAPGRGSVPCPQGGIALVCEHTISSSVNANFRQVVVRVHRQDERLETLASVGGLLSRVPE